MPTIREICDSMYRMQDDLMKTNNTNLLGTDYTKAAWGELTDCIKSREKDKLNYYFDYLENVIHRDFRMPPQRLMEERKKYASGRALILSAVKPRQDTEREKTFEAKKTDAAPKPVLKSATDARETGTEDGYANDVRHAQVARAHTTEWAYEQKIDQMEINLKDTQVKLRQAEAENHRLLDRMTGDKLTRDNPDIADLRDPKRPPKLAEKYSQLYDDEWTDAMEKLTDTNETESSERRGIGLLVDILQLSHETCMKLADDQMKKLQRVVILEPSVELNCFINCPKQVQRSLQNAQNLLSLHSLSAVQKNVRQQLTSLKNKYGDFPLNKLTSFVNNCTEICWGMVMQSPRMDFLFPEEAPGMRFNKDKFKEFTRSGDKLDFVVWPAMVIQKQGSLLVKGTVQPLAKEK